MLTSKDIVKDTDIKIKEKSSDVKIPLSADEKALAKKLLEYVVNSTNEELAEKYVLRPAVGISAIQVGVAKKILAISYEEELEDGKVELVQYLLANAKIISNSVRGCYLKSGEGCLSVDDVHEGYVVRSQRIKVKAYDIKAKKEVVINAKDYLAIVFQHEIDHFNGILYYQHINKTNPFNVPDNCLEI